MVEDNRDIFPDPELVQAYPNAAPAIENPLTREAFVQYESRAKRARDMYVRWGSRAVWLIAVPAAFTVWEALLLEYTLEPISIIAHQLSIVFTLSAILGIIIHTLLYICKIKYKWLHYRFAGEVVRSIHFQCFSLCHNEESAIDFRNYISDYSRNALSNLEGQLSAGTSALMNFSPINWVNVAGPSESDAATCGSDCAHAYSILRIEYQFQFALGEIDRAERGDKLKHLVSDIAYFFGAFSVMITFLLKVCMHQEVVLIAVFEFIVILLLLFGFMERILEQIKIKRETVRRFGSYADAIRKVKADPNNKSQIYSMEIAALSELKNFCIDINQVKLRL